MYSLKIFWPDAEAETIDNVKKVKIDEGCVAWKDPETGLKHELYGIPVSVEEKSDEDEEDDIEEVDDIEDEEDEEDEET